MLPSDHLDCVAQGLPGAATNVSRSASGPQPDASMQQYSRPEQQYSDPLDCVVAGPGGIADNSARSSSVAVTLRSNTPDGDQRSTPHDVSGARHYLSKLFLSSGGGDAWEAALGGGDGGAPPASSGAATTPRPSGQAVSSHEGLRRPGSLPRNSSINRSSFTSSSRQPSGLMHVLQAAAARAGGSFTTRAAPSSPTSESSVRSRNSGRLGGALGGGDEGALRQGSSGLLHMVAGAAVDGNRTEEEEEEEDEEVKDVGGSGGAQLLTSMERISGGGGQRSSSARLLLRVVRAASSALAVHRFGAEAAPCPFELALEAATYTTRSGIAAEEGGSANAANVAAAVNGGKQPPRPLRAQPRMRQSRLWPTAQATAAAAAAVPQLELVDGRQPARHSEDAASSSEGAACGKPPESGLGRARSVPHLPPLW